MRVSKSPLTSGYQPELDVLEILGPDTAKSFQNITVIINRIVELGRFDINNLVALLSTILVNPRDGHLQAALHVFSYLKHYDRFKCFYVSMPRDNRNFNEGKNCQEHYLDANDEFPPNMPDPLVLTVRITCSINANHAGNQLTSSSYSGILNLY